MNTIDNTQTQEYKKIVSVMEQIGSWGMYHRSAGYCVSMSHIVSSRLRQVGIESRLMECSLMVTTKDPMNVTLIGHDGYYPIDFDPKKQTQNHVVCVTETSTPYIIDASIFSIDADIEYVIVPTTNLLPDGSIEIEYSNSVWTYKEKVNVELPKLYERSIIHRIETDKKVNKDIKTIRSVIILLIVISTINFTRGIFDFYQKYVNKTNNFGPTQSLIQKNQ